MASLTDTIKNQVLGNSVGSTETMIIEQALNKLFYLPPKPEEELAMIKAQYDQKQGDRYGLHASAIIVGEKEFCYREQVLSLFYKQAQGEQHSAGLMRIFQEGISVGEKWQRLFLRGGLGVVEDMDRSRFVDEYDLSYTPDVAKINIGKKKYLVEIKSMNTFQFKKATSHPSGRKQLKLYMYFEGIEDGFVLVEDKNDQNFKIFPEKNIAADMAPYIERLEMIQTYKKKLISEKKMVGRICDLNNCKRALKCNMRDACWNIGMGRIKLGK